MRNVSNHIASTNPADTVQKALPDFDEVFGLLNLQKLVARLASEPLFAISEIGEDEQVDYDSIKTFEDSGRVEMYYCDQQASWVIYISHEATIAIGGKVLIEELKKEWIDLKLYTNPWPGIC